jgi:zinc finger protein 830
MADIRALLKAKRLEARIAHPFATYTPSDQLKCVVCGTLIKHASAWEGHLGSKLHRTNTTRLKEEKTRGIQENTEEQSLLGKRKAKMDESDEQTDKKRRMAEGHGRSTPVHELPNDFFSDPSHVPVIPEFPSDESNDDANDINLAETTAHSTSVLDLEYDLFQRGFLADRSQTYDRATIFAEPVPSSPHIPGFPASPAVLAQNEGEKDTRDYEERELIMDRLLEEERAQEDADMRVHLMKNKLEGLKKRREDMKALKVQVDTAGKSSSRM